LIPYTVTSSDYSSEKMSSHWQPLAS